MQTPETPRCGAKTRSGEPCKTRPMANGRCRMHGGSSLSGPAHPNWVDGTYSKVLPKRLLDGYQASINDPDRLALDQQLGLLDARLLDVLQRIDSGESGQLWRLLKGAARDYEAARRANDPVRVVEQLALMLELINRGHTDQAAWAEARQLIQERRKIAESERKRQVQMHQVVSSEAAMALLAQLVVAVQTHVHDDDALAAISSEYRRLVGTTDR